MSTESVLIAVENPLKSYVTNEITNFLKDSQYPVTVWDVLGDVDNLVEVPFAGWEKVTRILTDRLGLGVRIRHFMTSGRKQLGKPPPGGIQVFTFVRIFSCETKLYTTWVEPTAPLHGAVDWLFRDKKNEIENKLRSVSRDDITSFQISCGGGIGFAPSILIEGLYRSVFKLEDVLEKLHRELNHAIKTISYISIKI